MEEQDPHDDLVSKHDEAAEVRVARDAVALDRDNPKEVRKMYRRYPPPLAGHLLGDSDAIVNDIINKFNEHHPPRSQARAVPGKKSSSNGHDLFRDPLPRAVTSSNEGKKLTQESPLPLTSRPAMQDENAVTYRQRTAPQREFVAPDPTLCAPPVNLLEQYTRRAEKSAFRHPPLALPITYAVLDEATSDVPNPKLINRGESTYKTLTAKRPPVASAAASFKSPRAGKAVRAPVTQTDEPFTLSKMMAVSSRLLESKAEILQQHMPLQKREVTTAFTDRTDTAVPGSCRDHCAKIELKLAL
jgi:hypothetical protein